MTINIKNYDGVRDEVFESLTASLGAVDDEPDSNISQITEPFTNNSVDLYQRLDETIQSLSPNYATGEAQNRCYAFNGLIRHDPVATTVPLILNGTEGTVVPVGRVVSSSINSADYNTDVDATITKANLIQIKFEIGTVAIADEVSVFINAVEYKVTAISADPIGATEQLTDKINSDQSLVYADNVGAVMTLQSVDLRTVFSADAGLKTTIFALGTPVNATGAATGKISAPARSVNIITTAVSGWDSVDNLLAGQRGRNIESGEDFRERRLRSFLMAGGASVLGLQAKILNNVSGVSFCRVYENATSDTDEFGRPAHCVHVVAEGGTDTDITNEIALNKSGGITTFGAVTKQLADSEGNSFPVNFDRPTVKYVWVEVTINTKNFEETFPPDGLDLIRQAVYDFGSTSFGYGDDLILQRFYTPVYAVPGIKDVSIRLAITDAPTPVPDDGRKGDYVEGNISIPPTAYTEWLNDPARIIVLDVSQ